MSRVAKIPILLPKEVEATVTDQTVILKGSQGTMSRDFSKLGGDHQQRPEVVRVTQG